MRNYARWTKWTGRDQDLAKKLSKFLILKDLKKFGILTSVVSIHLLPKGMIPIVELEKFNINLEMKIIT